MRRTSRILRAVNWRYALGEIALIVVGILIALAISNWNERRVARQGERALLREIRSNLAADTAALQAKQQEISVAVGRIGELIAILDERPRYDTSMDRLFGAPYGMRSVNLTTGAYETLKSIGLQKVTDRELRTGIARVYDQHFERLTGEHAIDVEVTLGVLRPYYLAHFRDLEFSESATPLDYDELVADPYFRNIVDYRRVVLTANQLKSYPEALAEMRAVIHRIDAELGADPGARR